MDGELIGAEEADNLRQSAFVLSAGLVARGDTVAGVAERLGVSDRTIQRWRKQDDWQRAYKAAQAEIINRARSRLVALTETALNRIEDHLREEDPARARLMQSQAETAWKVLKHAGVEIEVQAQEAPRRIVTRLPQATVTTPAPLQDVAVIEDVPATVGPLREVKRGW